jgi:Tfp pilus assembly protein PilV
MFGRHNDIRQQSAPRSALRRFARNERGMGLIETIMATTIFVVVSTVTIATLVSSTTSTKFSKDQTIAEQGANALIEKVKLMADDPNTYNNIGTVNGNPPGTLAASQAFTGLNGVNLGTAATMTTKVVYVSSNVLGSYTSGNSYKKLTVTITRNSDGRQLAQMVAYIAPPLRAAGNTATINTTITDYGDNTPVPGSTVNLATGPSAPSSDTTDSAGKVQFAGLTPNPTSGGQAYYDLSVVPPSGYSILSDTVSPNSAAHVQLSPTQVFNSTLFVYKPVTINVALQNPDTSAYTGNATITITSSRGSGTFNYTGTPLTITTLTPPSGELLVPGLSYTVQASQSGFQTVSSIQTVPTGYPTTLSSTFTLTMTRQTGTVNVLVQRSTTKCKNATVTIWGGPTSIPSGSPLTANTNASTGAAAQFLNVPVGSGYSIKGKSNVTGITATLSSQTVNTGTNNFTVLLASGSTTC